MSEEKKSRYWAFIGYPDSLPSDWQSIVRSSFIACAVSPLHSPEPSSDGSELKPHYHFLLQFSSPRYSSGVLEFSSVLNATVPFPVHSLSGYYRYLAHLDDPDKEKLDINDVLLYNDFKVPNIESRPDFSRIYSLFWEYVNFPPNHGRPTFHGLSDFMFSRLDSRSFDLFVKRSFFFINLLKSLGG